MKIIRFYTGAVTLGLLLIDREFFCFTLEPPPKKNQKGSCILPGTYMVHYVVDRILLGGGKVPRTYMVQNVPGRDGILFHTGNSAQDTNGCILVGLSADLYAEKIYGSRLAFDALLARMGELDFQLNISDLWN